MPSGSAALAVLLMVATVWDVRSRRVPIWLTIGGSAMGLILSIFGGSHTLTLGILGFAAGLILLLPLVLQGAFGGADGLVLGMVGAWLGWPLILWAAGWTALAGGVLALLARSRGQKTLPYVPAIAVGAVLAYLTSAP